MGGRLSKVDGLGYLFYHHNGDVTNLLKSTVPRHCGLPQQYRWAQFYEAISQKIFFSQMMPSLSFHHCDLQNIINPGFKVEPAFKMNPPKYSEVSTESQGRTLGSVTWAGGGGLFSKGIGS